jgi:tungstate transport system substrate-binding protein
LEVWKAAGVEPQGAWYTVCEKGKEGNAPTLKYVDERQSYTLIDRATYITLKSELSLRVLVENDPILLNYISLIPISPAKFPHVKYAETMKFVNFLTSAEGQQIIRDFGKDRYGEPLFFPNSPIGRKLR